jgi:hypothetical protein
MATEEGGFETMSTNYLDPADQLVALLERRMLYVLQDMTFEFYFDRPYDDVLDDHLTQIPNMPPALRYPGEDVAETANRIVNLRYELSKPQYNKKSLSRLCQTVTEVNSPELWAATEQVDDARIFVPYLHSRDKQAASDVFGKYGFLNPHNTGGWAEEEVRVLFTTSLNDLLNSTDPMDAMRLESLTRAKSACIIRPHL